MPAGRSWPVRGQVQVRFGKPLTFDRYRLGVADQLVLRAITDQVMYEIMMLSGQTYIDEYVTSAKARQSRAAAETDQAKRGDAATLVPLDEADDTDEAEAQRDEADDASRDVPSG
jgi:1-acyl-sn-glycerol-3-phosphate acyltransferase